jgi:predicted DNA-binding protein with PD1-like motif
VNHAVVGLYRTAEKKYTAKVIDTEMEMTSLLGNVTTKDGEVYLHLHADFADSDCHVFGGHLNEAIVSATCELFIHILKGSVERKPDGVTALNIMDL